MGESVQESFGRSGPGGEARPFTQVVSSTTVLERLGIASEEFPVPESVRTWLGVDTVAAGRR